MAKKERVSKEEKAKRNAEIKEAIKGGSSVKEVAKKFKLSEIWVSRVAKGCKPKKEKVVKPPKAPKAPKASKLKAVKPSKPKAVKTSKEGVDEVPADDVPSSQVAPVASTGEPTV